MDALNPYFDNFYVIQVAAIARQFGVLHDAFKFDALHLLTALLSAKNTVCKFLMSSSLQMEF